MKFTLIVVLGQLVLAHQVILDGHRQLAAGVYDTLSCSRRGIQDEVECRCVNIGIRSSTGRSSGFSLSEKVSL